MADYRYTAWRDMWIQWGVPTDKIPTEDEDWWPYGVDFELAMWTNDAYEDEVMALLFENAHGTQLTDELRSQAMAAQANYERRGTVMADVYDLVDGATGGYFMGNPNWFRDLKKNWRDAAEAALEGPGNLLKGLGSNMPWWVWAIGGVVLIGFVNGWSGGGIRKLYKD